ncbi:MAG: VWA domain-containing protein [Chloroflexi bacterium]|nr:VWA domain-containing protein [Chloroflexota bacterium]
MNTRIPILSLLFAAAMALFAVGCAAPQDASKSYSRAVIDRGEIVPAARIREAEYLNYYDQQLPEPANEALALDVRLGNASLPAEGGDVWVQIGLQARSPRSPQQRTPLNLALVLDRSGSMGDFDKMNYLKQALRVFLSSLRPDDIVAIVAYNDEATVIHPAAPVGDGAWIDAVVSQLQPNGRTNLYDGLMLGFQEVDKHFDIRRNNRVILLTDGIANVGVIDADAIAADARRYNERGVYLSTIGLGLNFNDELLSALARQGNGAYHFIDSAEEMEKVFREEAAGLVEKVARDVTLRIEPAGGALVELVGYEGEPRLDANHGLTIKLQEMGAGDSQVVLVRFRVEFMTTPKPLAHFVVRYTDVFADRPRELSETPLIYPAQGGFYEALQDVQVRRNVTIVRSARALKQIDALFNQGRYLEAWELARNMEAELRAMAAQTEDAQLVEDADLFRRYQMTLARALGYDPALERPSSVSPPEEGSAFPPASAPTPTPPIIEIK